MKIILSYHDVKVPTPDSVNRETKYWTLRAYSFTTYEPTYLVSVIYLHSYSVILVISSPVTGRESL